MFAFKHAFFQDLEDYFKRYFEQEDSVVLEQEALLPDLVKEKLLSGSIVLKSIVSDSTWMGMTYHEELEILQNNIEKLIEKGEYPTNLWN
jgi:hypothetical protein